jgi:4-amino-4-deoxy-L-arabinose transferase-like glycosyltransferase
MQASLETTRKSLQKAHGRPWDQTLLTATTVAFLLLLCLPVITAHRSPLNSDQSLYIAEALNIANGEGLTYPTGEPITHRAPLYPAMLAGAFKLEGTSLEAAHLVPRLAVVANVILMFFLGRAFFGPWGGGVAGIVAAASLYLRGLGTTLYLDSTQVSFLLAALLVYWGAGSSVPRMAAAGALLGASFLVKEASVLFLPLPVIISLLYGFESGWKKALPAWFAGFAATTAWWFVWVYIHTGHLFLGPPAGRLGTVMTATSLVGFAVFLVLLRLAPKRFAANRLTIAGAALLLSAWNVLFFTGLDSTGWQFESNYLANIGAYLTRIFLPNVQPAVLILGAIVWLLWSAPRSRAAGSVIVSILLYASFFMVVADRGLSLRDQLPVIYLSYIALGGAAAWLVTAGSSVDLGPRLRALGGGGALAVAAVLAAIVLSSGTSLSQAKVATLQDDWDNSLSHQTASWLMQNVEPGAAILSSRLYYSHLYFLTDGAYPIHQLPTVEVDLDTSPGAELPVSRRSTLFRWEGHKMASDSPGEAWLYLTRYPQKGYFIGLAETDLLAELQHRDIEYVVISTLDAGFSSPSHNRYFEDNPAFELVQTITATPQDQVTIYRVDLARLAPQQKPAQITASVYEYMVHRLNSEAGVADYLDRVNPAGFRLTER